MTVFYIFSSVESCQNKARYLLNFAGVSRAPTRKMTPEGSPRLRPSWATKGKNWNKISTAVSTVGKLKQQVSGGKGDGEGGGGEGERQRERERERGGRGREGERC